MIRHCKVRRRGVHVASGSGGARRASIGENQGDRLVLMPGKDPLYVIDGGAGGFRVVLAPEQTAEYGGLLNSFKWKLTHKI